MLIHSPKELAMSVISQRKKLKLSQAKVADLVGLKQQTVSDFECRPESTKLDTLFHILSAVNLDIDLFTKDQKSIHESQWQEGW